MRLLLLFSKLCSMDVDDDDEDDDDENDVDGVDIDNSSDCGVVAIVDCIELSPTFWCRNAFSALLFASLITKLFGFSSLSCLLFGFCGANA